MPAPRRLLDLGAAILCVVPRIGQVDSLITSLPGSGSASLCFGAATKHTCRARPAAAVAAARRLICRLSDTETTHSQEDTVSGLQQHESARQQLQSAPTRSPRTAPARGGGGANGDEGKLTFGDAIISVLCPVLNEGRCVGVCCTRQTGEPLGGLRSCLVPGGLVHWASAVSSSVLAYKGLTLIFENMHQQGT